MKLHFYLFATVLGLNLLSASAQDTASGPDVLVKATGQNCGKIQLPSQGGCANGGTAYVDIPDGAEIIEVRYYTTACWPGDADESNEVQVTPNVESAFSMFELYSVSGNRVTAVFHNRSSDRDRFAAIEVDYQ